MSQEMRNGMVHSALIWTKWKLLRLIQIVSVVVILAGAYPFVRPFISRFTTPPGVVDSFVLSLGLEFGMALEPTRTNLEGIVFIGIGAVVIWATTSKWFQ